MKYLVCITILLFAACNPQHSRKAAIVQQMIYNIPNLHFDINTPAGHPEKIEELIISGWEKSEVRIKREYFYKNDRLIKVTDNESGENETYTFKYDYDGRCIFIEQQTVHGPVHKDSIKYYTNEAVREHFLFGKSQEKFSFRYPADSLIINMRETGVFRESNDTMYVTRTSDTVHIDAYDKNNRKIATTYMAKGLVDHVSSYIYDDYGNELSFRDEYVDNNTYTNEIAVAMHSPTAFSSQYEYDSRKNWTLKQKQDPGGYFRETIKRKITYAK